MESKKESKWSRRMESTIKNMSDQAIAYKWIHIHKSNRYSIINSALIYSSIAISGIVGFVSGYFQIQIDDCDISTRSYENLIISTLGFISAGILGVVKVGNFDGKCNEHKTSSTRFSSIVVNTKLMMSRKRKHRDNIDEYVNWLSEAIDSAFESSPTIYAYDLDDYNKRCITTGRPIYLMDEEINLETSISSDTKKSIDDGHVRYQLSRLEGII